MDKKLKRELEDQAEFEKLPGKIQHYEDLRLRFNCEVATEDALEQLDRLREGFLTDPDFALQLSLDLSTFDCNKPNVIRVLQALAMGLGYRMTLEELTHKLDTNSQRRLNVLFQPGTILRAISEHDKHEYPLGSLLMVTRHVPGKDRGKVFMAAIGEDGKEHGLIYIYDVIQPAFWPEPTAVDDFFKRLVQPADIANCEILRKLSLPKEPSHE